MILKYIVKIDYKYFEFDDKFDALNFAEMAAFASDGSMSIEIEIRKEAVKYE